MTKIQFIKSLVPTCSLVCSMLVLGSTLHAQSVDSSEDEDTTPSPPVGWGLYGNSSDGTATDNSGEPWLGTSDGTDLIFKTAGQERMRLRAQGNTHVNDTLITDNLRVISTTFIDSVRSRHIRANRITSFVPGDSLIYLGDNSIIIDHTNDHIYAVQQGGVNDLRVQCQPAPFPGYIGTNHTLFNSVMGNVGIGVGQLGSLPTEKLHVVGNIRITGTKLHVSSAGNVGIGTSSPQGRLDVRNTGNAPALRVQADGTVIAGQLTGQGSTARIHFGDGNHYIGSVWGKGMTIGTFNATDAIFIQEGTGKIGIGVGTNHSFSEGLLEVNGTVRARKAVVEISGWGDYVFSSEYELMDLGDLRSYVNDYSRLPEIPSAVDLETNGLDLGEIVKLQMKKIEELTLYILQLEERLGVLEP